jgi:CelD/BcsL family acetyltransferase involved in cellulose biosynthesis
VTEPTWARWRSRRGVTVEPPLRGSTLLRSPSETLPFPFDAEEARIVGGARSAWLAALSTLGLRSGDEALVDPSADPALLTALAARGVRCRSYRAAPGASREPVPSEALLSETIRAVVLSHPLGFARDAEPWREWCGRHGLLLLEDVAHALHAVAPSGPVGRHGHAAVFRLRPVLGTPDGAVLMTRPAAPPDPPAAPRERAHLPPEVRRWSAAWRAVAEVRLHQGDGVADGDRALRPASSGTRVLLPVLADGANADRRRANFRALLELLSDLVPDGWWDLPAGSSPLVFPVEARDPVELLERLRGRRINGLPLFAPGPNGGDRVPPGLERSVGLPVHQELAPADLDRMVAALVRDRRLQRRPARLEVVEDLSALRDAWDELALRTGNPFASWRWASVWWRLFGRGARPAVVSLRRTDGGIMAILPLYEARRGPLKVARFLGHGPADELGPVCDPADLAEVGWALRRAIVDRRLPWDIVLAERMPVADGWSSALGGLLLRQESSPAIALEGLTWQRFLHGRSRNFRDQVGRRERKLQREHTLRYRLSTEPERLEADLEVLFGLHRARWGTESSAFTGPRERFHREWAAEAQRAGWLRLWFLELDGRSVAAWYGLRFAETEFYYQAGRDPALENKSVGFVLLAHTIRAAVDDGMREYRLLRGGEPYNARFATHDRALETRAVGRSYGGAAAVVATATLAASRGRDLVKALAG